MRESALPEAGARLVAARLARWLGAGFGLGARILRARLAGEDGEAARGEWLRATLGGLGASAIKLGHQLALRPDILPLQLCNALSSMPDRAPPMDVRYAIGRIERASGRPIEAVFSKIDPEPIVSDTVSCVYQAELADGERVAIKVRRQHVNLLLSADLRALGIILGALEFLTVVRPGRLSALERELRHKLAEELDFVVAARYQRVFRKRARRARLKFLSAARVHVALGSSDVMVSEFVPGVWCQEVVDARVGRDLLALESLERLGVDPAVTGRRLLQAMWWAQFENPFFPVEPRATNIVVQPGNRIVFVNLGECGRTSTRNRELYREVLRRLIDADVSGASDALLQLLAPLPYIDADDFRARLERGMWQQLFSMQHREGPWWERTTTGLWIHLLETANAFAVPVRLPVVRMMRGTLTAEMIAGRLWPRMDHRKAFRRYLHRSDRRFAEAAARRGERAASERSPLGDMVASASLGERLRRTRFWIDTATRELPVEFMSLSAKGAYAMSALLRLLAAVASVVAIVFLALLVGYAMDGSFPGLLATLGDALRHPISAVVLATLGLLSVRRILFRLNDRDSHD